VIRNARLPHDASFGPIVVTQGVGGTTSHTGFLHYSWDFGVPFGTPILAIADGWVVDYFDGAASGQAGAGNAGNIITLRHEGGYASAFHLEQGSIPEWIRAAVDAGGEAQVLQGQILGIVGNTGFLTGPHIHISVGSETVNWGGSTGHSVVVANGHLSANPTPPVTFVEVGGSPLVGQSLTSQNEPINGTSVGLSDADAILAGTFLALSVYGGTAIPASYRSVLTGEDDELNYDDRYGSYLSSLGGTPWTVLTEAHLNASWFVANGERVGSVNTQGLYLSAPETFLEVNLNEAMAATTTIAGRKTLVMAFRGSDGRDAGYESQTWTSFGTIDYYLGVRPFIGAVAD